MAHFERMLGHTMGDRYTLVSIIGEGESAVVFGAYDTRTEETVALKMLHPDCEENSEAAKRFESEISVLSQFDHPNIVKLLDEAHDGKYRYFVMEYIEGITLKKHIISRGALELDEILFLSEQILSALAHVHEKNIVHSDIKPQNIVIVDSGDIKLMDFGISKSLFGQTDEISDVAVGTVQYVSPEQAEGKPLDHLSDLYSFGVMLYEMATGILPFIHENANRIAAMHVSDEPIPPSYINEEIPIALENIILRSMEKLPADRFASADDLMAALKRVKDPQEELPPEPFRLHELLHRRNLPTILLSFLSALLISIAVGFTVLSLCLADQGKNHTYIKVPALVGETLSEVEDKLLDPELYNIEIRYIDRNRRAGEIVSQSPRGGSLFKTSDGPCQIKLTVARLPLPDELPSLIGLSKQTALDCLRAYTAEVEVKEIPHVFLPEGGVIAAVRNHDKQVTLYVAAPYRENLLTVPSFVGMTAAEARAAAAAASFALVTVEGNGPHIVSQSLTFGTVADGAKAELILNTEG